MPELGAWFISCVIFGLIHAINALFGQDLGQTLFQIGFAFAGGVLMASMLVHARWDFSTLSHGPMVTEGLEGTALLGLVLSFAQWLAYGVAFIALVRIMMRAGRARTEVPV